jgi:hypothetical protein
VSQFVDHVKRLAARDPSVSEVPPDVIEVLKQFEAWARDMDHRVVFGGRYVQTPSDKE